MSRKILVIASDFAVSLGCGPTPCLDGYEVQFCDDAATAVQAAAVGGFDAIVVSQTATESDSLEVLRQIKAANVLAPVLIVSRNPTVEAAVAAMKEGAADYTREPCSPEELRSVLSRIEEPVSAAGPGAAQREPGHSQAFEGMLGQCPPHARGIRFDRAHCPRREHCAGDRRKRNRQGDGSAGDPSAQPSPRVPVVGL